MINLDPLLSFYRHGPRYDSKGRRLPLTHAVNARYSKDKDRIAVFRELQRRARARGHISFLTLTHSETMELLK